MILHVIDYYESLFFLLLDHLFMMKLLTKFNPFHLKINPMNPNHLQNFMI